MTDPVPSRPRKRRLRLFALIALLVVLLLLVTPFVFTAAIVRYMIARTDYAAFYPEIEGATLSPLGGLEIDHLKVHEPAPHQERILLEARSVQVPFKWTGLLSRTFGNITADNVVVHVRPDSARTTLPRLVQKSGDTRSDASPPWFDGIQVTGQIQFAAFPDFGAPPTAIPLNLSLTNSGDRKTPTRWVQLRLGDTHDPGITATLRMEPTTAGTRFTLQDFHAKDLQAGLAKSLSARYVKQLPANLQQDLQTFIKSLSLSGTVEPTPNGAHLSAKLTLNDLAIATIKEDAFKLTALSLQAEIEAPLTARFLTDARITNGNLTLNALDYGENHLRSLSAPFTLENGTLSAPTTNFQFAEGKFFGSLLYNIAHNQLGKATFKVDRLEQEQLAKNLAPEKFDARGPLSGTISLETPPNGTLDANIDLRSDEPGLLIINDKQTAELFAPPDIPTAETLPPDHHAIELEQLKRYPYKTAHITLTTVDGSPALTLDYRRDPVKEGEPGFGIRTKIAGKEVTANYTVQIQDKVFVLKGQTIPQLLALAAGLKKQLVSEPPKR